ncbi:hypothetical protein [Flagellimonas iocasae]|uniref:Viral A-type inclusion protein n=1 Tax=Flagellimonas iocasae TaxID=2055905 RepID=A0ABW4XXE6_9FLAO
MKNYISLSILILTVAFTACKEEKKASEGPTQMEHVMAVHDEVMPKMSAIGKLVGELKAKVDTTETGQQYATAMKDLQDAHAAMMDWMQNFGNRFDHEEILQGKELSEQKQVWLNEEEEKVMALKEQINGSIESAESLLAKGE